MNVGKIHFQVQDEDPSFFGPGQSVALNNATQIRGLLWEKSRTEHCHFFITLTVQCERCGTDSGLEQCRWTCDVLEGLSVHMEVGVLVEKLERLLRCIARTLWKIVTLKGLDWDTTVKTNRNPSLFLVNFHLPRKDYGFLLPSCLWGDAEGSGSCCLDHECWVKPTCQHKGCFWSRRECKRKEEKASIWEWSLYILPCSISHS